ncbi:succinylglutamate desuccinylase/aspartoacylase family protein [Francisella tularensis]|uniref:succinylglutamate desuccinylase/aspartoacylase family protein n=1 Tax=Francisella tularensis TaxID=263 RepID=UPI0008F49F85|nr:succinylglutamate desuccinylase/aspartoacylase family protein [Francisella tularensis]APA83104.1 putative deacylase [Francisella tularensis subsp. novicida PA10-7858]
MKFKIFDNTFQPGEMATLAMPLPSQYSCAPMYLPIKILNGVNEGPCILIFGMVNGDEFNSIQIINSLLEKTNPKQLNGTIVAIPVLNVFGLVHSIKHNPTLEQAFPGDENGSYMHRYAYRITQEIIKKANYSIQIKTGAINHEILPQVYFNGEDEESIKMARAFQAPVITAVNMNQSSIRKIHQDLDIPFICYEAGEANKFGEEAINVGIAGIQNVMRKIALLEDQEFIQQLKPLVSEDTEWTVSDKPGILRTEIELGTRVKEGQKIGKLIDPFGNDESIYLKSPIDGIILGINNYPMIKEGDLVFKISSFQDDEKAEAKIEDWEEITKENFSDE